MDILHNILVALETGRNIGIPFFRLIVCMCVRNACKGNTIKKQSECYTHSGRQGKKGAQTSLGLLACF
jgi:hypothetical protein